MIQYTDGSEATLEILNQVNVRDWCLTGIAPQAAVGWRGEIPDGNTVELLVTTWENPRPDESVKALLMRTDSKRDSAPFCLAITVDSEGGAIAYPQLMLTDQMQLIEGVWENHRGEDEEVNWLRQELSLADGVLVLTNFGAGDKVLWKGRFNCELRFSNDVRTMVLTDLRRVAPAPAATSGPAGPFFWPYTIREGQLLTVDGLAMTDQFEPAITHWSRKAKAE